MNTENNIEKLKQNGYDLDFNEVFTSAYNHWKNILLPTSILMLIVLIIYGILISIALGAIGSNFGSLQDAMMNDPQGFQAFFNSPTTLVSFSLVAVLVGSLAYPLLGGLYNSIREAEKNSDNANSLSFLFSGFKSPNFGRLFIIGFILSLVSSLFSFLLNYSLGQLGGLVNGLVGLGISTLFVFAVPLAMFSNNNAIDALGNSISLSTKKYLYIAVILLVSYFIVVVGGFITCLLGFFVLPSFVIAIQYSIYSQAVGFSSDSEIEKLGTE